MSLVYDGQVVATNSPQVTISRAAYEALPTEQKNDPNVNYYIYDEYETEYKKLVKLMTLIGSEASLAGHADGTIIGVIKDIYDRLGGLAFKIDPEYNHIEATLSDENPNNVIQQLNPNATDSEKIAYLETLLGNPNDLTGIGYDTLVSALLDFYAKLDGLTFAFRTDTETVQVTDTK